MIIGLKSALSLILSFFVFWQLFFSYRPHVLAKYKSENQTHSHASGHKHQHIQKPLSSLKSSKIYSHRHHSGGPEHNHQQDLPHPPTCSFVAEIFNSQPLIMVTEFPNDINLSIFDEMDLPEDPFLRRMFRPPIT